MLDKKEEAESKSFKLNSLMVIEIVALFAFLSYFFLSQGLDSKLFEQVKYQQSSNKTTYKVYLKPNDWYKDPYLDQNTKTYISSLIDYFDIDFDYGIDFDNKITGTYIYSVQAIAGADVNNDGVNDWKDEHYLIEPTPVVFKDQKNVVIKENVKVKYDDYNDKLMEFNKDLGAGLETNSTLTIRLNLEVKDITNDKIEGTKSIITKEELSFPLTTKTSDVKVTSSNSSVEGTFERVVNLTDLKYTLFLIIGGMFGFLAFCLVLVIIGNYFNMLKGRSEYTKTLKKILTTYDGIIVSTKTMPDLSDLKIIKVNSMQELLDAHNEVRMPINFIEVKPKQKSEFILINGEMVWVYTLKDRNYKNGE